MEILEAEHKINAEVVDLRSIRPLDQDAVLNSVRKTHRAVLVDENKAFCGVSSQFPPSSWRTPSTISMLRSARVGSLDAPAIYSPAVEPLQLPYPATGCLEGARDLLIVV